MASDKVLHGTPLALRARGSLAALGRREHRPWGRAVIQQLSSPRVLSQRTQAMTMNDRTSSRPTLPQTVALTVIALVVSAALYSRWFRECCMGTVDGLVAILFLPAMLVQLLLGAGSVHSAPKAGFYVGAVVQFYLLFWLYRWLRSRRNKQQ